MIGELIEPARRFRDAAIAHALDPSDETELELRDARIEVEAVRTVHLGYSKPITEIDPLPALEAAKSGRLNYINGGFLASELGTLHQGDTVKYWDMEHVGERPVPTYIAHGGFMVNSEPIFRSRLTPRGEELLARLEARSVLRP